MGKDEPKAIKVYLETVLFQTLTTLTKLDPIESLCIKIDQTSKCTTKLKKKITYSIKIKFLIVSFETLQFLNFLIKLD